MTGKISKKWPLIVGLMVLMVSAIVWQDMTEPDSVLAQDGYSLLWWQIGGGELTRVEGDYALGATVGQAETATLTEGDYSLTGGFWANPTLSLDPDGGTLKHQLYLPLVLR